MENAQTYLDSLKEYEGISAVCKLKEKIDSFDSDRSELSSKYPHYNIINTRHF